MATSFSLKPESGSLNLLKLCCPSCAAELGSMDEILTEGKACRSCGNRITLEDGIVRALSRAGRRRYARFLDEYSKIRHAEGRGSESSDYYRALPYRDLSGKHADQWAIRGGSYRYLEERI